MDLVDDRASMNAAEEDRISRLADDIIHRILSFLDMKLAVQTSALSRKWKLIWTTMPYLNIFRQTFHSSGKFVEFVKHALSQRNNRTEVSAVKLSLAKGTTSTYQFFRSIVEYAYSHNVGELSLIWDALPCDFGFPLYLFSCHTLRHLTLESRPTSRGVPYSTWDLPALETLNLRRVQFRHGDATCKSLNPFSKCVNLKDLSLQKCFMYGCEIFHVSAPKLSNLTITDGNAYPKVINVVAPQLRNLTADINGPWYLLQISTEGFNSLERVKLSLSVGRMEKGNYVPNILDLFQKLHSAKFLTLNMDIMEALSSRLYKVAHEPCPFDNLKCLKIDMKQKDCDVMLPTQVTNYLLDNSPNATFIMGLAQVPQKRSRKQQQVHADERAKKVAKLEAEKKQLETNIDQEKKMFEAKLKMQDEDIANQKAMLEAANLQHQKLISHTIKCRMADLKVQIESGNPDYQVIRSVGFEIRSAMELIPESLRVNMETQFSSQYEEVKSMFFTRTDALWKKIETELLGNISHSDHSNVHASELLPASKPSSVNVQTQKAVFEEWETRLRREMADREAALTASLEALRKDMDHKIAAIMQQNQR